MASCRKRCDNYSKFYTLCQPTNFTAATNSTKFLHPNSPIYDSFFSPTLTSPSNILPTQQWSVPEELKFPTKSFYGPPMEGYDSPAEKQGCKSCKMPQEFPKENFVPPEERGFDKNTWGPCAWGFLHAGAWGYPKNPSKDQQILAKIFYETLPNILPCDACEGHCANYIRNNPPKTESRDTLTRWLHEFHNSVNERLGKSSMEWEEARRKYEPTGTDNFCGN